MAHIDVQAEDPGHLSPPPGGINNPLTAEKVTFYLDDEIPDVTGTIHNNLNQAMSDISVTALAYDANDQLVDAGTANLPFILAGQETAVEVPLNLTEKPARVELLPYLSGDTEFLNAEAPIFTVEKAGALLQDNDQVEAIIVTKNSAAHTYENIHYVASLYDAQGHVLATFAGGIPYIIPNGRAAQILDMDIPEGTSVARLVVQCVPPDSESDTTVAAWITANPLVVSQVKFQPDANQISTVTANLTNTFDQGLSYLDIQAVLYDSTGQIIGGGSPEFDNGSIIPAGCTTQVDIPVDFKGQVASEEVFASTSDLYFLTLDSSDLATAQPPEIRNSLTPQPLPTLPGCQLTTPAGP